jgi:hypothetical protein
VIGVLLQQKKKRNLCGKRMLPGKIIKGNKSSFIAKHHPQKIK